jgi:hypothetical protein
MTDNQELATRKREQLKQIKANAKGAQLQTLDDYWTLANAIVGAGMSPVLKPKEGIRMTAAQVMIAMQMGAEVGLPPMTALKNIAVIGNRPTLWGDAVLALIHRTGELEDFDEGVRGEGDAREGYCTMKRRGLPPVTRTFSVADARAAGLLEKPGPWKNYRDRMLQMRSRGFTARDTFPDALGGFMIAEEVQDYGVLETEPPVGSEGLLSALRSPASEPVGPEPTERDAEASGASDAPWGEVEAEVAARDGSLFSEETS